MPGEIIETNADAVSENNRTARWTFPAGEAGGERLVVRSRKATGVAAFSQSIRPADVATVLSLVGIVGYVWFVRSDYFDELALDDGCPRYQRTEDGQHS